MTFRLSRLKSQLIALGYAVFIVLAQAHLGMAQQVDQEQAPQTAAPYSIDRLVVKAFGNNALEAREEAMRLAKIQGLQQVVRNLVPRADWKRLATPSDKEFEELVDGIDVIEENQTNASYLAQLSLRFNPLKVRRFLSDNQVRIAQVSEKPLLVIPVLETLNRELLLFDLRSTWQRAWDPSPFSASALASRLADGTEQDRQYLNEANVSQPQIFELDGLRDLYQADGLLLAYAREVDGTGQGVQVLAIDSYVSGALPLTTEHRITCERKEAEDVRVFHRRCATTLSQLYLEDYKTAFAAEANRVQQADTPEIPPQTLQVFVIANSNEAFADVQQRVQSLPSVQTLVPSQGHSQGAFATLTYTVPIEALVTALLNIGIEIFQDQGQVYLRQRF